MAFGFYALFHTVLLRQSQNHDSLLFENGIISSSFVQMSLPPIDFEQEKQKSFEFVQSIQSTKRRITFVHLPKNAGTTSKETNVNFWVRLSSIFNLLTICSCVGARQFILL